LNYRSKSKELTAKDGVQINKDVATNTYTLIIPKLNPSVHAGTITARAVNVISSVEHDVNLEIQGIKINCFANLYFKWLIFHSYNFINKYY